MRDKILFVADAASVHTAKWVDFFLENRFEVALATFAQTNITKCDNIFYLSARNSRESGGNYHYLLSVFKLARVIRAVNPDYLNAHFSYSMGFISMLAKIISGVKVDFSIVCHGSDVLIPPYPVFTDRINKMVLNNADKVFAVSDQIADKILQYGVNSNKMLVGQYGVECDNNLAVHKDIDIISNRAFVSNSRLSFLLEALKEVSDKKLNILFVLPGSSEEQISELAIQYPFIRFTGSVPHREMYGLVKRSLVYISATKSDGASLSLLEAMNGGAIPVVSNIPANRSWIVDGVNGYLFRTSDEFVRKLNLSLCHYNKQVFEINSKVVSERGEYKKQMESMICFLKND